MSHGAIGVDVSSRIAKALDRKLISLRTSRGRAPDRARVLFAGPQEKACYIDGAAREDAKIPGIKSLAAIVGRLPPDEKAEELYQFVRRNVDYLLDPDGEEFTDALTTLIAGQDDCDGTSRCYVALCLAAGLESCIRAILSPDGMQVAHFQALVRWPGSTSHRMAMPGGWVLADTTIDGIALGEGAEAGMSLGGGKVLELRKVRPGEYGPVLQELRAR